MGSEIKRVVLALQSTAVGGMETHVIDLAAEYRRRGITVLGLVPAGADFDGVAARMAAGGARVARADTDARHGRLAQIGTFRALTTGLRTFSPDAVHVHTGGATGGAGLVALARVATNATVVITEHDVPAVAPSLRQRLARQSIDRAAHAVIAVSRRNAGLRAARLGAHSRHFVVVLNGVPLPTATSAERLCGRRSVRQRFGIACDEVVIGSLVRLAEGKGLETLLPAFAEVRAEHPCRLLLVGDGPLRGELGAMATSLGIAGDVAFAGHQPQPAAYLDAMDIFALAVPAGSMSIALLEAMARGLPPVITFGGPEEAVIHGETGLTSPPGDVDALAEALGSLVADDCPRRQLGVAAEEHVRRNYSVARVADDLLAVYAGARGDVVPARLRAHGPPDQRPGEYCAPQPSESKPGWRRVPA